MLTQASLSLLLQITYGGCWSLAYLLIIRQSFKDKIYGMPIAAVIANITWEFYFSFIDPWQGLQLAFNIVWLAIDLIIFYQIMIFAPKQFPQLSAGILRLLIISFFPFAFMLMHLAAENEFLEIKSAFAQNLMMSLLFIGMLLTRGNTQGQHIYIAVFKCIGTASAAVLIYFVHQAHHQYSMMTFLYISIFIADLTYIILLLFYLKKEKIGSENSEKIQGATK